MEVSNLTIAIVRKPQKENFRLVAKSLHTPRLMGSKRTLPPTTSGQQYRPNFGITQKNERAAIDAGFKRVLGNDAFGLPGSFRKKRRNKRRDLSSK
jgi:hypothetical protein